MCCWGPKRCCNAATRLTWRRRLILRSSIFLTDSYTACGACSRHRWKNKNILSSLHQAFLYPPKSVSRQICLCISGAPFLHYACFTLATPFTVHPLEHIKLCTILSRNYRVTLTSLPYLSEKRRSIAEA